MTAAGIEKPPAGCFRRRFSPKFVHQNTPATFRTVGVSLIPASLHDPTVASCVFYTLHCVDACRFYERYTMKQPCFLGVPLTFAGWVPQSPFASRRVPTVWNGQGQKFGQKATSFDFATRAIERVPHFPAAVNENSHI